MPLSGNSWQTVLQRTALCFLEAKRLMQILRQSTNLSGTFLGSMTVNAFFLFTAERQGYLSLKLDISSNFTQTTDGVRFAITSASIERSV